MQDENTKKLSANEITNTLRQEIAEGIYAKEDRLPPERILADRFNAARGTIRRAIQKLAEEGLVVIRPGSGTYVDGERSTRVNGVIANASPMELIDTRLALEPHMCRLAVLSARQQDFEGIENLLRQMEASVHDINKFSELDSRFHAMIAKTTNNELLIWIVSQINAVRNQEQWSLMRHLTLNEEIIRQYNMQHRQIIDAIRSREPERAATKMKQHLETARLSLTRSAET